MPECSFIATEEDEVLSDAIEKSFTEISNVVLEAEEILAKIKLPAARQRVAILPPILIPPEAGWTRKRNHTNLTPKCYTFKPPHASLLNRREHLFNESGF